MRSRQVADTAHVAGRTRRSPVVAGFPLIRRAVPHPFFALGRVDLAMLAVLVDLDVRMVRSQVAACACLRLAGLRLLEGVTCVTDGAVTDGLVGPDRADAGRRPGVGTRSTVLHLDSSAVALDTSSAVRCTADLGMVLALMSEDQRFKSCLRFDLEGGPIVTAHVELGDLILVALGARVRGNERRYGHSDALVVLDVGDRKRRIRRDLVAVDARNSFHGVNRIVPVGNDAGCLGGVTLHAAFRLVREIRQRITRYFAIGSVTAACDRCEGKDHDHGCGPEPRPPSVPFHRTPPWGVRGVHFMVGICVPGRTC